MKDPNVYPPGWNAQRVREVIDYYDAMSDDDLAAEIDASDGDADADPNNTMMSIPTELVPAVQTLLNEHAGAAQQLEVTR